jgi:hypothetical protein
MGWDFVTDNGQNSAQTEWRQVKAVNWKAAGRLLARLIVVGTALDGRKEAARDPNHVNPKVHEFVVAWKWVVLYTPVHPSKTAGSPLGEVDAVGLAFGEITDMNTLYSLAISRLPFV